MRESFTLDNCGGDRGGRIRPVLTIVSLQSKCVVQFQQGCEYLCSFEKDYKLIKTLFLTFLLNLYLISIGYNCLVQLSPEC